MALSFRQQLESEIQTLQFKVEFLEDDIKQLRIQLKNLEADIHKK